MLSDNGIILRWYLFKGVTRYLNIYDYSATRDGLIFYEIDLTYKILILILDIDLGSQIQEGLS